MAEHPCCYCGEAGQVYPYHQARWTQEKTLVWDARSVIVCDTCLKQRTTED